MHITLGDPSGIGPEVIIKALNILFPDRNNLPIIIGDTKTLEKTSKSLGIDIQFQIIENIKSFDNKEKSIKSLNANNKLLDKFKKDYPIGPHDKPQSMCPAFGSLRVGLRMRRVATSCY